MRAFSTGASGIAGKSGAYGLLLQSPPMSNLFGLIPAAGSGSRMGAQLPKQYLMLAGKPVLHHAVAGLCRSADIEAVIVVLSTGDKHFAQHDWSEFGDRLVPLYCGGATRAVLFVSSFSVYGEGPQRGVEETAPQRPETPLARSRAACEERLAQLAAHGHCAVTVLRTRFVLGAGDRHVLPGLAGRRELHLAPGAVEQVGPERLLQLGEAAREGRLGDRQCLRRLPKMQASGHLAEVHEVPELKGKLVVSGHGLLMPIRHQNDQKWYFLLWQGSGRVWA